MTTINFDNENIEVSEGDIEALSRIAYAEAGNMAAATGDARSAYGSVVDVVLNRAMANRRYMGGTNIEDVINHSNRRRDTGNRVYMFSPIANAGGRGWEGLDEPPEHVKSVVRAYVRDRGNGKPNIVGRNTHFLNPYVGNTRSSTKPGGWAENWRDWPSVGTGRVVHHFGDPDNLNIPDYWVDYGYGPLAGGLNQAGLLGLDGRKTGGPHAINPTDTATGLRMQLRMTPHGETMPSTADFGSEKMRPGRQVRGGVDPLTMQTIQSHAELPVPTPRPNTPVPVPTPRPARNPAAANEILTFSHKNQTGIKQAFRDVLESTAQELGTPLNIVSGHRTRAYNDALRAKARAEGRRGPAKNSRHIHRDAADIDIKGMNDRQKTRLVETLIKNGAKRFITYAGDEFIHVDLKDQKGDGKPYFMHDFTARNMKGAPNWFREIDNTVKAGLPLSFEAPIPTPRPDRPASDSRQASDDGSFEDRRGSALPPAARRRGRPGQNFEPTSRPEPLPGLLGGISSLPIPAPTPNHLAAVPLPQRADKARMVYSQPGFEPGGRPGAPASTARAAPIGPESFASMIQPGPNTRAAMAASLNDPALIGERASMRGDRQQRARVPTTGDFMPRDPALPRGAHNFVRPTLGAERNATGSSVSEGSTQTPANQDPGPPAWQEGRGQLPSRVAAPDVSTRPGPPAGVGTDNNDTAIPEGITPRLSGAPRTPGPYLRQPTSTGAEPRTPGQASSPFSALRAGLGSLFRQPDYSARGGLWGAPRSKAHAAWAGSGNFTPLDITRGGKGTPGFIGTGMSAIDTVMAGQAPMGFTARSRSDPTVTVTSLGPAGYARTTQWGTSHVNPFGTAWHPGKQPSFNLNPATGRMSFAFSPTGRRGLSLAEAFGFGRAQMTPARTTAPVGPGFAAGIGRSPAVPAPVGPGGLLSGVFGGSSTAAGGMGVTGIGGFGNVGPSHGYSNTTDRSR